MIKQICIVFTALLLGTKGYSQKDTAAIIQELAGLLSFTEKPYLGYEMEMQIQSYPVLESSDTLRQHAQLIKKENDLYFNNGRDEMIVLDSLLFRISNERRSIWISKVGKTQKNEGSLVIPGRQELARMLQKGYQLVDKPATKPGYKHIELHSTNFTGQGNSGTLVIIYDTKKKWPETIEFEIQVREQVGAEMIDLLKEEGLDLKKLVQQEQGSNYIVRRQSMLLEFKNIRFEKEELGTIPGWSDLFKETQGQEEPTPRGKYAGYEVRKLY